MSSAIRARRLLPLLLAVASACAPVGDDEEGYDEEQTEEETPDQISSSLEDELPLDPEDEVGIQAASVAASAAEKGAGPGGSVEVGIDFNKWTDQMLGWIHKKANSDHYYSMKDMWLFFEGNHCSQNLVGSVSIPKNRKVRGSIKDKTWFVNDEARSVLINKGRKGQKLWVADNSGGSKSDDWAEIKILKSFNGAYCIGTFESDYRDDYIKIVYHHHNGLDGKISWVANHN